MGKSTGPREGRGWPRFASTGTRCCRQRASGSLAPLTAPAFTGASNHLDFVPEPSSALLSGFNKVSLDPFHSHHSLFLPHKPHCWSLSRSRSKANQGHRGHRTQSADRSGRQKGRSRRRPVIISLPPPPPLHRGEAEGQH